MAHPTPHPARSDHPHEPRSRTLTIQVNEHPVKMKGDRTTGLEIKTAAKAQGVPIELDFVLVEELGGGRTRVVGDADPVHLTPRSRFLANDGDDNS